jgi:hypothetical protein
LSRNIPPEPKDGQAEAELFVTSILPRHKLLKVFAAEAGQQQFAIRSPTYIVGADVLQVNEDVVQTPTNTWW